MTSFTAVYEDVKGRVTSEVASSKEIPSDDLLRAVRRVAKGHYCGLGGLSNRRPARVTREECAATREEGTRTFQGWDSIDEITPCLAPVRISSSTLARTMTGLQFQPPLFKIWNHRN